MAYKHVKEVAKAGAVHHVGDGFRVKNYIDRRFWQLLDPFLMFDYNEPWQVLPTDHPRGVGAHPHKGFETISIAWKGEVSHADSSGGKGTIGPGDVQWMTAGKGLLHKEYHSEAFSKTGGEFQMAQLWVNLPAAYKNVAPKYQDIRSNDISNYNLPASNGYVRVIAGELHGIKGPASTHTRINLFDAHLKPGSILEFEVPDEDSLAIAVLSGNVLVNDEAQARTGELVALSQHGRAVKIESNNDAHLLILGGEPIRENIVAQGPFVMNTKQQILDAFEEFDHGAYGTLN